MARAGSSIINKGDKSKGTDYKDYFFDEYFKKYFPQVLGKQRVMNAFWKWSDFPDAPHNRLCFLYGYEPIIETDTKMGVFDCEYSDVGPGGDTSKSSLTDLNGYKLGNTRDKSAIYIHPGLIALTEDAMGRAQAGKKVDRDNHIFEVIEATVVHEMIHWSYKTNDVDEGKKYKGDWEFGTRNFEIEAYGHEVRLFPGERDPFCFVREVLRPKFVGIRTATVPGESRGTVCKILSVSPGSLADKAGLKADDVLVSVDSQDIFTDAEFSARLAKKKDGDKVALEILRGDRRFAVRITLETRTTVNNAYETIDVTDRHTSPASPARR